MICPEQADQDTSLHYGFVHTNGMLNIDTIGPVSLDAAKKCYTVTLVGLKFVDKFVALD